MTESEKSPEAKPLFQKGELHTESTRETVFVPNVGFVETDNFLAVSAGDKEAILNRLRARGFTEDAIAAFLSGKIIQMVYQETPLGTNIVSETWKGKEKKEEKEKGPADLR